MSSICVMIVVVAATAQIAECKSANQIKSAKQDGLRQAKANPDRDVEHMRCLSFKLFTDEVKHDAAETKCEEWGGKLASLNTVAKIQFVSGMLEDGDWAWIGAECVDCETVEDDKWMWKSGDRLDLQNPMWKKYGNKKTPYDNSGNDAVYLMIHKKDGDVQFVNFKNNWSYPYLCEKQIAECNSAKHVEHMRGPSFKLFTDKVHHDVAETKCEDWGGKLASLNTIAKIQFVSGMLEESWVWIGGDCVDCETVKDDKWMWVSGDRLDLQNPMWKDFDGQKPPYDDEGTRGSNAIHLMIRKYDGEVQFVNWGIGYMAAYLCEK